MQELQDYFILFEQYQAARKRADEQAAQYRLSQASAAAVAQAYDEATLLASLLTDQATFSRK